MNEEKLRVLICLWLNKAELLTLLIIQNMQFVIMKDVKEWRELGFISFGEYHGSLIKLEVLRLLSPID